MYLTSIIIFSKNIKNITNKTKRSFYVYLQKNIALCLATKRNTHCVA